MQNKTYWSHVHLIFEEIYCLCTLLDEMIKESDNNDYHLLSLKEVSIEIAQL